MKEIKDEYILYSAMVGGAMYGILGAFITAVLLVIIMIVFMIVIERRPKEKFIKLILRALAYVIGAVFIHFFIYFRIKYNF